jgi:ATP-dependent Clp protease ATP-binding subunit ClpC
MLGWHDQRALYWGRAIDSMSLWLESSGRMLRRLVDTVLILCALVGITLGIIKFAETQINFEHIRSLLKESDPEYFLFWLGILALEIWLYRHFRQRHYQPEAQPYSTAITSIQDINYDFIKKLPKKHWVRVSGRYSGEAIELVDTAFKRAWHRRHKQLTALHLLSVMIEQKSMKALFARLGLNPAQVEEKVERQLAKYPKQETGADPEISNEYRSVLFIAFEEAIERGSQVVEVPDIMTALLRTTKESQAIMVDMGIDLDDMRNVVMWVHIQRELTAYMRHYATHARLKPKGAMNRSMTAVATPFLNRFSVDMTMLAKSGRLDYCVGRNDDLEILFRTVETNGCGAILVGNPGVGRKTIIAGLAQRMVAESVPPMFQDKRLVSLSIGELVAGASAPGEIEERLLHVFAEVSRSGNIIIFIDDIHNLVGVTSQGGKGFDLASVLAEHLNRLSLIVIGVSDPINYRRYLEQRPLSALLQKLPIDEMDAMRTTYVLESKVGELEYRNKVYFTYAALANVIAMSRRYIADRYMPEKAVRLLEETAAYVRRTYGKDVMVTAEHVAEIVSQKMKVPVTAITQKESDKLLHLEDRIHERMVDQSEAVSMVAAALRRARAELRDIKRPIANFMFLGPTGVGKTELSKTVAEVYFGSEKNMVRLDMSEYQDISSISRLIGDTAGGGVEGGYLTEAVRRTPYTMLLLDEIEKAHPDILNLFLQIMDEGRLTDSLGRTIDFSNVILIATSNAGTPLIQQRTKEGVPVNAIRDELINDELTKHFPPEFINRFDGVMVFKPLSHEDLLKIAKLLIAQVVSRLEEKGITLKATDEALRELVEQGYDPLYGARPLRRVIQNTVDNALANYLLQGKLTRRDVAVLEAGGYIRIEKAEEL